MVDGGSDFSAHAEKHGMKYAIACIVLVIIVIIFLILFSLNQVGFMMNPTKLGCSGPITTATTPSLSTTTHPNVWVCPS